MMKLTKKDLLYVIKKLQLDLEELDIKQFIIGINVEFEHGYANLKTNVTNNDLLKTAKIALAHIIEYPDYYKELIKMEKKLEKRWKNKNKPNLFLYKNNN